MLDCVSHPALARERAELNSELRPEPGTPRLPCPHHSLCGSSEPWLQKRHQGQTWREGHGLADAEVTGTQSPIPEPASPSGPRSCPHIPTMKDKLPTVKAALEWGLGGACTLAGGHGEAGLPPLPHLGTVAIQPAPSWRAGVCVCRLGQAGADTLVSVGLLDSLVCAGQMLKRLTSKGKQSRTQIPPLKTWAEQGVTVASVGFISQEDLCREGKGSWARGGSPAHLRACGCLSRLRTRMCVPICCTAHSHVLHWHMHL